MDDDAKLWAEHVRENPRAYESEPTAWPDGMTKAELIRRLSALISQWQWACRVRGNVPEAFTVENARRAVRVLELAKARGLTKADRRIHDVPGTMTLSALLEVCIGVRDELERGRPAARKAKGSRRKREATPPTTLQAEALRAMTDSGGNMAEAARRMNLERSTVRQHYRAALAKLGMTMAEHLRKVKRENLRHDRRGQADVAAEDDRRRQ